LIVASGLTSDDKVYFFGSLSLGGGKSASAITVAEVQVDGHSFEFVLNGAGYDKPTSVIPCLAFLIPTATSKESKAGSIAMKPGSTDEKKVFKVRGAEFTVTIHREYLEPTDEVRHPVG
jgi:hypothetical protein